jgi:hypothetical protein
MIEIEKGQLTWIPKTVIFEGKEYQAPLDLLPILAYRTMLEFLVERKDNRNNNKF